MYMYKQIFTLLRKYILQTSAKQSEKGFSLKLYFTTDANTKLCKHIPQNFLCLFF